MRQQDMIRVDCAMFTKLFLVKEAQLLKQGINDHINSVIDQCFDRCPLKPNEFGLIGYFINPILKDCQSEIPFKPTKALLIKFLNYRESDRKYLVEKALNHYVLLQLCNAKGVDHYADIATEILEDLAQWKGGAKHMQL